MFKNGLDVICDYKENLRMIKNDNVLKNMDEYHMLNLALEATKADWVGHAAKYALKDLVDVLNYPLLPLIDAIESLPDAITDIADAIKESSFESEPITTLDEKYLNRKVEGKIVVWHRNDYIGESKKEVKDQFQGILIGATGVKAIVMLSNGEIRTDCFLKDIRFLNEGDVIAD